MGRRIRLSIALALVGVAALAAPATRAEAASNGVDFHTTAKCVDGSTEVTLEIIDLDPDATVYLKIYTTSTGGETLLSEGEFAGPNLASYTDSGAHGFRVDDSADATIYESDLLDPCNDSPPPTGNVVDTETVGDLVFTTYAACDNDGFTLFLNVKNTGNEAVQIYFNQFDFNGGGGMIPHVVGDKTFSISRGYYGWAQMTIWTGGAEVFDTGVRTANDLDSCGILMPDERKDLTISLDPSCANDVATVTILVSGESYFKLTVEWTGDSDVLESADGSEVSTWFDVPFGQIFSVEIYDQYGRRLFESGDLIGLADGCVKPTIEHRVEFMCVNLQPQLEVDVTSNFADTTTFNVNLYVDNDDLGYSMNLAQGETHSEVIPLASGNDVDYELEYIDMFARQVYYFEDYVVPVCTHDGPIDGSGSPLPDSGSNSTPLMVFAGLLVAAGASMLLAGRRRTA